MREIHSSDDHDREGKYEIFYNNPVLLYKWWFHVNGCFLFVYRKEIWLKWKFHDNLENKFVEIVKISSLVEPDIDIDLHSNLEDTDNE